MIYFIVAAPRSLTKTVTNEVIRLMKKVYKMDINGVYYRVKTQSHSTNPKRLFHKGDGRIVETFTRPKIGLIQGMKIDAKRLDKFIAEIESTAQKTKPFTLTYNKIGNYNDKFTFFLEYKKTKPSLPYERICSVSVNLIY